MHLNPHTILPLLCMMLAVTCGTFVILQNPKTNLNQIFLALCITFAAWFSFYIPCDFYHTDDFFIKWTRISFCFISFIPITGFTFITTYLQVPKNEFWFKVNAATGLTFCVLSITTNWIIQGFTYYPWFPYPHAGILHPFLILHCVYLVCFGLKLLIDGLRNPLLSSRQRNHIKYMISAWTALSFAAFDFIANYNIPFYPLGFIPVSAYLLITTIAIIRHQLMDIQIVIRKSLIYSLLVTTITFILFICILISDHLFDQAIHGQHVTTSIITASLIALIFTPLKNKIQDLVDRAFLKATPMEIAQQNEQLRQEVIQTEKFKAVAALASSIVHEIRNPLTAINTFAEYIPQKKNDPLFLEQFAQIVPSEINRINALMQELLTFAKPSEPKFESIDPNLLIQNLIKLVSPQMARSNIQIHINLIDSPVKIQADPSQLKQALLNIIMNAIDAMPDGGTLTIKTELIFPNKVLLSSTNVFIGDSKHFIIEISDTGCGIGPKDLPHIFDPFFTKKEKGTGLGLAISQGIIEKQRGKILVKSQLNQGTTFTLTLPQNQVF